MPNCEETEFPILITKIFELKNHTIKAKFHKNLLSFSSKELEVVIKHQIKNKLEIENLK